MESGKRRYPDIPATLTAYQILADMEGQEAKLDKMEAWLLKQRKPTGWNNTYYTSQILETILGRLLDGGSEFEAPQLLAYTSTGVDTIRVFPYERMFLPGQLQQLVHRGQTPIYTTAYQTRWDTLPQVADSLFALQSYWIHQKDTLTTLEAGQKIKLSVRVEVKKDAEYVLLEIPIPAGCSYSEHGLGRGSHEAYREQKRDRVGICFKRLPKGIYSYDVFLQARFPGTYTINPPKMELMYFPTKNGRGEMERLDIK